MQVYLVGGAVRDQLLGLDVGERDWVVVGATPQQMEHSGYRAVGRDFPVYLHPQTHEEYALARLERKTAPGYRGFTTQFSPDVTLEQDLQRRDLTINAMARAADGSLIDPFGGRRDLAQRQLRHVSDAFVEDPVRVLRVARFAARFAALGFTVAPETQALLQRMVQSGEINALVPERLWRELERSLGEATPEACFDTLQSCGALAVLLPELHWEPSARAALRAAVALSVDPAVRFAALLAGNHADSITALCARLRVASEYRELALAAASLTARLLTAAHATAAQLIELLEAADAFRRPRRFGQLLLVAQARATTPSEPPRELLSTVLTAAAAVTLARERIKALSGPAIGAELRAARIATVQQLLQQRAQSGHYGNKSGNN